MSTSPLQIKTMASKATASAETSNMGDVLVSHVNSKRIITLSRPKALNALSLHMIRKMYPLVRVSLYKQRLSGYILWMLFFRNLTANTR